ncbi:TIGR02206 family membrane protein [Candidatus Margulisiibacteriota bacterium]
MKKYFSLHYPNGNFELFSLSHILTLVFIVLFNIAIIIWLKKTKNQKVLHYFEYGWAALLIGQELASYIWLKSVDAWSIQTSLPLHLCGVGLILAAIMLINKNYFLFEITYFWGFAGSIQALLTPDLTPYPFPHFVYIQFFVCHAAIITAVLYMVFIKKYRPTLKSILKVAIVTNLYMIFIAGFNLITNANYLYICHKPQGASLLDFFGPWPWYILGIEIFGFISCLIYYLPFAVINYRKKEQAVKE